MKLLVVSWQPLHPVNSGYRRRVTALYGELSKHLEVRVVAPGDSRDQPLVNPIPSPSTWRGFLPKGKLWETFSPAFRDAVAEQAVVWKPDIVLAEGLWSVSAARYAARQVNASFGITIQNIESESAKGVYPFPFPQFLKSYEKKVYGQANWLVAITKEEARIVRALVGDNENPILVVPNGATPLDSTPSADRIARLRSQWDLKERDRVVLFTGRLDYPPNRKGLEWFSNEVFPMLQGKHDGVRWIAIGEPVPESPIEPFEFVGFVDDLDAACATATLAISPIRHGSGTSIKVLDLLARGVPIVATPESVRGLGNGVEQVAKIAEAPGEFSESIQAFMSDSNPTENRGHESRRWVEDYYLWSRIAHDFHISLKSLTP